MFHVKHFNFKIYYYVVALFIQLHKLNAKDSYFDKIIQDVVCYNKYNFYILCLQCVHYYIQPFNHPSSLFNKIISRLDCMIRL